MGTTQIYGVGRIRIGVELPAVAFERVRIFMRRNRKLGAQIFTLICTIVVVVVSAIPLYNRTTDAKVIALFFGAFGAGVMLAAEWREHSSARQDALRAGARDRIPETGRGAIVGSRRGWTGEGCNENQT